MSWGWVFRWLRCLAAAVTASVTLVRLECGVQCQVLRGEGEEEGGVGKGVALVGRNGLARTVVTVSEATPSVRFLTHQSGNADCAFKQLPYSSGPFP